MPSNHKPFIDVRQGLKQVLMQVQKPARYTGGEYNEVIKDPAGIDVRFCLLLPRYLRDRHVLSGGENPVRAAEPP